MAKKTGKTTVFMEREAVILTEELRKACEDRVKETFELAKKIWKIKYTMPEIRYDLKSMIAGTATPSLNRLRFHPIFLVENETDYIKETIPHEVAHLLVPLVTPLLRKQHPDWTGKIRSHGNEWKAVMDAIGRGPKQGESWKDVIKHKYDPASLALPPKKKLGPRKPGGRKVGEILMRIKGLNDEEMEALKLRLGFEIGDLEPPAPPTAEELAAIAEHRKLGGFLERKYLNQEGDSISYSGWAHNVIQTLEKSK